MALELFGHPLSSFHQKALIAFYEMGTAFTFRMLDGEHPENLAALAAFGPAGKFPVLVDDGRVILESSMIIEYVAPELIPADAEGELEARTMDRVFDNYVMTPMQKFAADAMRPEDGKDPAGVADAHAILEKSYAWLDRRLAGRSWAAGEAFTIADCAAAPALFYADWNHPIAVGYTALTGYLKRLQARPSVARAAAEAEPYLHMVPVPRQQRGTDDA